MRRLKRISQAEEEGKQTNEEIDTKLCFFQKRD
jgi:hypothetical protein